MVSRDLQVRQGRGGDTFFWNTLYTCIYNYKQFLSKICPHVSLHVPTCPYMSPLVPVCPCLSPFVPICPRLSPFVPVCPHLSLSLLAFYTSRDVKQRTNGDKWGQSGTNGDKWGHVGTKFQKCFLKVTGNFLIQLWKRSLYFHTKPRLILHLEWV